MIGGCRCGVFAIYVRPFHHVNGADEAEKQGRPSGREGSEALHLDGATPRGQVSVIDAKKAWRYKEDEATNRVLQMQVRRAIERLKKEGFGPSTNPPPEVPSAGPVAAAASA